MRCGGHVFAGLARKQLLAILQARCAELGVDLRFHAEVSDLAQLGEPDLIIAADGVNSLARRVHADAGCDDLVLFPAVADLAELDRLAEVVSGLTSIEVPRARRLEAIP